MAELLLIEAPSDDAHPIHLYNAFALTMRRRTARGAHQSKHRLGISEHPTWLTLNPGSYYIYINIYIYGEKPYLV